jgi:hypothetical protein
LISEHLADLQQHKLPHLSKQIGIDVETLLEELQFIRTLDPYPGRRYSSDEPILISPEIYIEKLDENDEDYVIYFADDGSPRLRVSPQYQQMLSQGVSNETKSFIREKMRSAVDLLRNIEHRRVPGPWRAVHQADDVERHCRRHRHAPFDSFASGESQVRPHAAGRHRAAPVLYRGHAQ